MSSVWESCPYLRVKCWGLDKVGLCFYLQKDIGGDEGNPAPLPQPWTTILTTCPRGYLAWLVYLNSYSMGPQKESVLFPVPSPQHPLGHQLKPAGGGGFSGGPEFP